MLPRKLASVLTRGHDPGEGSGDKSFVFSIERAVRLKIRFHFCLLRLVLTVPLLLWMVVGPLPASR
jgi:hypothetical protein